MSLLVNFTLYADRLVRDCAGSGKQSTLVCHDIRSGTRCCSPCTRSRCVSSLLPGSCFRRQLASHSTAFSSGWECFSTPVDKFFDS